MTIMYSQGGTGRLVELEHTFPATASATERAIYVTLSIPSGVSVIATSQSGVETKSVGDARFDSAEATPLAELHQRSQE